MLFMLEDLSPSLNIDLKKEKSRIESSNFLSLERYVAFFPSLPFPL